MHKVRKIFVGTKGIRHLVIRDARTIHHPIPFKVNDTIWTDLESGKTTDFNKFDIGNLYMVIRGVTSGRIGVIASRKRQPGSLDVVPMKDANGNIFASPLSSIFVIAKATNHGFLFSEKKISALPLLKRETRDWQPNRAVSEMTAR